MLENDIRDALRQAKAKHGLQMFHTANQAIRMGLPLVLANVHAHLSPQEVLEAATRRMMLEYGIPGMQPKPQT